MTEARRERARRRHALFAWVYETPLCIVHIAECRETRLQGNSATCNHEAVWVNSGVGGRRRNGETHVEDRRRATQPVLLHSASHRPIIIRRCHAPGVLCLPRPSGPLARASPAAFHAGGRSCKIRLAPTTTCNQGGRLRGPTAITGCNNPDDTLQLCVSCAPRGVITLLALNCTRELAGELVHESDIIRTEGNFTFNGIEIHSGEFRCINHPVKTPACYVTIKRGGSSQRASKDHDFNRLLLLPNRVHLSDLYGGRERSYDTIR